MVNDTSKPCKTQIRCTYKKLIISEGSDLYPAMALATIPIIYAIWSCETSGSSWFDPILGTWRTKKRTKPKILHSCFLFFYLEQKICRQICMPFRKRNALNNTTTSAQKLLVFLSRNTQKITKFNTTDGFSAWYKISPPKFVLLF
jgi:hypothetical protein